MRKERKHYTAEEKVAILRRPRRALRTEARTPECGMSELVLSGSQFELRPKAKPRSDGQQQATVYKSKFTEMPEMQP
jgi:hypothetical protein